MGLDERDGRDHTEDPTVRVERPTTPAVSNTVVGAGRTPTGLRLSRAPVDLSQERRLRGAATVEIDGVPRPAIGGYAVLGQLGRGGMGVVYYAVNPRLLTEVAIKVLPVELQERDTGLVDRFHREARLAAQLRSEHLVGVLDVNYDEPTGHHFIVMEFVHGRPASDWLRPVRDGGRGPIAETDALAVCTAAARGLAAAHRAGVIHRDVKPHNVLVPWADEGTGAFALAKLSDLGLARPEVRVDHVTQLDTGLGTPGYAAPEQLRDAAGARKSADVFGLGASLYALLAGEAPFRGASTFDVIQHTLSGEPRPLREIRPDVSQATLGLVERCLARDTGARLQDADEFLAAIDGGVPSRASVRETDSRRSDFDHFVGSSIGQFQVLERLGVGDLGPVFKVLDPGLGRISALRVFDVSRLWSVERAQRFVRESVAAAQVSHPNIVAIHMVGRDESRDLHYVVMEYVDGRSLANVVRADGPFTPPDAVAIVLQACDALAAVHDRGIVHLRVRPTNLLLDRMRRLKIADFGVAGHLLNEEEEEGAITGTFGTTPYSSPEQFCSGPVDARTDVYSLGGTFHFLLTGQPPFARSERGMHRVLAMLTQEPEDLSQTNPAVPKELAAVIRRMLAATAANRYATFRDAARDLRSLGLTAN